MIDHLKKSHRKNVHNNYCVKENFELLDNNYHSYCIFTICALNLN